MTDADDQGPTPPGWRDSMAAAISFFTVLPVPAPALPLGRAAWTFPIVGAGIGLIAGLAYWIAHGLGLASVGSAVVALIAQAALTGALHEDGLADTADGLGARGGREARLAAMRAHGIGAFGVLALVLLIVGRVAALGQISQGEIVIGALIAAGSLSRAGLAFLMHALSPARSDGLGFGAGRPTIEEAAVALLIGAGLAWLGAGFAALILGLVVGAILMGAIALLARHVFGGQTGDVLGAAQAVTELGLLLTVAALA
jgi:adenosylcobinamide-GDP ribazoletransferase